jgi:hypothetical protein
MKFNKDKTKKILKATLGLLLLPIIFALFTVDRIILVFLPHIKQKTFGDVLKDLQAVEMIIYRIIGVSALYGVYMLLKWIF